MPPLLLVELGGACSEQQLLLQPQLGLAVDEESLQPLELLPGVRLVELPVW